jgi:hypothetical protein
MGTPQQRFGHYDPWAHGAPGGIVSGMTSPDPLRNAVSELVEAAHAFDRAAEARGSHRAAPDALASLQEALQTLGAGWYRLAADAGASRPAGDLSREREVSLIAALHDVAAAFTRGARACREGRSTVAPIIARRMPSEPGGDGRGDAEPSWFASRQPPAKKHEMSSAGATSGSEESW